MFIPRQLEQPLIRAATQLPVVAILGPRQSGKTTLAKVAFPTHGYVSLEALDIREFATTDPRGFIAHYLKPAGLIIDEIQQVPTLLSYIQTWVDETQQSGQFILTGSQNILLNQAVSQSLAGRIALCTLLPLSIGELNAAKRLPQTIDAFIVDGGYPRIYGEVLLEANPWYRDYIQTYLERDVRTLQHINNLSLFRRFIQLCAGRIGQLLNVTSLANDCGINNVTAKNWLSVLEASYIIHLLTPYHNNYGKRLIKSPKLYFYDTGIACALLGIETCEQLHSHYLRGSLFENTIAIDLIKQALHHRKQPNLYFWRDNQGHELDGIIEHGNKLLALEIKAGATFSSDYLKALLAWCQLSQTPTAQGRIIYTGDTSMVRQGITVLRWQDVDTLSDNI